MHIKYKILAMEQRARVMGKTAEDMYIENSSTR